MHDSVHWEYKKKDECCARALDDGTFLDCIRDVIFLLGHEIAGLVYIRFFIMRRFPVASHVFVAHFSCLFLLFR